MLPLEAQWAPAFGVNVGDMDGDGREDVFLSQNFLPWVSTCRAWMRDGAYGCKAMDKADFAPCRARRAECSSMGNSGAAP